MVVPEVLLIGLMSGVFTVLWWLLRQKDARQEEMIRDLYKKHEDDARALNRLELKLAELYSPKHEIREMLAELRQHFDQRFDQLTKIVGGRP